MFPTYPETPLKKTDGLKEGLPENLCRCMFVKTLFMGFGAGEGKPWNLENRETANHPTQGA